MRKTITLCILLLTFFFHAAYAQEREITGKVMAAADGGTLPGVTVFIKGTTTGTTTQADGTYKLKVPADAKILVFSSIGMTTKEVEIGSSNTIDVKLDEENTKLDEVVVTALGVSREKKSLGYATQEISGDKLTEVKSGNFVNQISGKVAGVQVKNSGNMGGSTNIVIRGTTSILGNNQALFVVDGVPINNTGTNDATTKADPKTIAAGQSNGASGYDYGSPVADINPEDIESMNVLKGAAATALYGSRAANGVIIITTKKGKLALPGRKRFGVTLSSNVTMGIVDKSTFPTYQDKYGAGYGPYYTGPGNLWFMEDINGDGIKDQVAPYKEDGSFGPKFDPNLMVYQWESFIPGHANYKKATPWVSAGENGPISFFNKAMSYTNGFSVDGGTDKGSFRVSYSNNNQKGILPNSSLKKDNFGFNGGIDLTEKLSASVAGNYVKQGAVGRNSTGYNANELSLFRQWWQTNVNVVNLKDIYDQTKLNYTWNPASSSDPTTPIFWDNMYYQRNESYASDERDRFFGNMALNYKLNNAIGLMTRISVDQYSTIQEERLAVGSNPKQFGVGRPTIGSGYSRYNKNFREINFDFMANFKKDFNENYSLTGLLGTNIRRSASNSVFASTNGGLVVPRLYSLSNSKETPSAPVEAVELLGVNGFFGSASFGFQRFLYLDVTARQDYSSTLPAGDNSYFYPGVAMSFIFSEKLKSATWLDFGKVRVNYAKVGKDAPFASIKDVYTKPIAFAGVPLFSLSHSKNNPNLVAELSTSVEGGLEMMFLKRRLGFDFAVYNTNTENQIVPVAVSTATGYSSKYVNAGTIQNRGIELSLFGTPVQTKNFNWTVNFNFGRNRNKVTKLFEGVDNLQIANFQGGVTLNATLGEAYGTLQGTDFVYLNGKKVVGANGYYLKTTTTDNVLGNINPDFNAGISNTLTYKSWSLSFLVDMQQGGDVFSLDMYYGLATGLYPETALLNDLGNPERNPLTEGGGIILDGVTANGQVNTKRVPGDAYGVHGYRRNPDKPFIYDASYVKLREASISYRIPFNKEAFFSNALVSLVGSNLWIIHKNLPYADPEAGLGAGNVQGFQTGVLPTTRNFGFNLTLQF